MFEPSDEARTSGLEIKAEVESRWSHPDYYFHLLEGGHVAALKRHIGNRSFLRVDIADFFGCVSRSRVARLLKAFFPYTKALRMATDSTVELPTGAAAAPGRTPGRLVLPYGFVQSPLLASLALKESALGAYLQRLRSSSEVTVTVFMDDIIVSADDELILARTLDELKRLSVRSCFGLNDAKQQGPARTITAFNIELTYGGMALASQRLTELQKIFSASTHEKQKAGILSYVNSVNARQGETLVRPA